MSTLVMLLNFGIAWWAWQNSKEAFEMERNGFGWTLVACSAINFATGLNIALK